MVRSRAVFQVRRRARYWPKWPAVMEAYQRRHSSDHAVSRSGRNVVQAAWRHPGGNLAGMGGEAERDIYG
ncbi:hypothetical protein GCM10009850_054740 [Nonomuraea monospora]|uniref:Uncharacterized protein n=1 Tax=Nonomuraea monospora TaxID=568818 RepID=A0ABN3CKK9_9ACTN